MEDPIAFLTLKRSQAAGPNGVPWKNIRTGESCSAHSFTPIYGGFSYLGLHMGVSRFYVDSGVRFGCNWVQFDRCDQVIDFLGCL